MRRAPPFGTFALLAVVTISIAACTLIVDNQEKGLSGTCTPQHAGDNVCGQCAVAHCQGEINAVCAANIGSPGEELSNLESCIADPSPGSNWSCAPVIGDAALTSTTITQTQNQMRHCLANNCTAACTTCTSIDAGTGQCGSCITSNCNHLLNGNDGCCEVSEVATGIANCTAPVNANCQAIRDAGAIPEASMGCTFEQFAQCVVSNCSSQCPQ